jgi:apolipoprotein N-acyltransferase
MLLLSQPPYGIWPLAFLGFVPVLVAQHRILPPRLSSLAQAIAIGLFLGTLIPQIFGEFAAGIWFFRWLFLIVGTIVFFTELGTRAMNQATGYRWFVLQGALVWVGIEMIRNLIPSIGTGGFIGYAYYRSPWLIQPVSLFGIFGINLLTLLLGYALGLGALAWFDRISHPSRLVGWGYHARPLPAGPSLAGGCRPPGSRLDRAQPGPVVELPPGRDSPRRGRPSQRALRFSSLEAAER